LRSLTPTEARKVAKYAREIAQVSGFSTKAMQSADPAIEGFESRMMDYIQTTFGPNKTIWNLTPEEYADIDVFFASDVVAKKTLQSAVDTINSNGGVKAAASAASGCTYDPSWPKKFDRGTGGGGYLPSSTGRVYNTPGETCDFMASVPANRYTKVYGVSLAMHNCVIRWGGFNGLSAKSNRSAAIVGYGRLAACTAFLGTTEWYVKNYLAFK